MLSAEYNAVVRSMIQHEDALRDQKLGWLFALNGFLFAALGFSWSASNSTALVAVLSVVGVVVALSSAAAMKTSDVAIRKLAGAIQPFDHGEEPPVRALRSADLVKEVKLGKYINLLYPWKIVPWFLVAAWVAVFAIRLTVD